MRKVIWPGRQRSCGACVCRHRRVRHLRRPTATTILRLARYWPPQHILTAHLGDIARGHDSRRTVFLTAPHCDQGVSRVAVTFDSSNNATSGTATGAHGSRPELQTSAERPEGRRGRVLTRAVKGSRPRGSQKQVP